MLLGFTRTRLATAVQQNHNSVTASRMLSELPLRSLRGRTEAWERVIWKSVKRNHVVGRVRTTHRTWITTAQRHLGTKISASRFLCSRSPSRGLHTNMAAPQFETIIVSVQDNIGLIRYNRPENANALDSRTMRDLLEALTWTLNASEVKVVLLTGQGKFFSAGMDLVNTPADGPVLPDEGVERLS